MKTRTLTVSFEKTQDAAPIERACFLCRFWHSPFDGVLDDVVSDGECRRRPPYRRNDERVGFWVATHADDWCGEFKRQAAKP